MVPIQQPKLLCSTQLGVTCHTALPTPKAATLPAATRHSTVTARHRPQAGHQPRVETVAGNSSRGSLFSGILHVIVELDFGALPNALSWKEENTPDSVG